MNVTSYGDSGLSAGTTYYYRVRAYNTVGNSDYSSTTQATTAFAPTVVTNAATNVGTSTTLNGSANPNGVASIGWFRYSTTTPSSCDNSFGIRAPLSGSTNLGSGTSSVPFSRVLGLTAGTTYFYCAIASSTIGTSFGDIVSFTTNP
jgi:hypothetical protein